MDFGFLGHVFWEIDFEIQYHLLGHGSLYGTLLGFELWNHAYLGEFYLILFVFLL